MKAVTIQQIECNVCHQFKQFDQFVKDINKKEGIRHICRTCQKIRSKEYHDKWAMERSRGQIEIPKETNTLLSVVSEEFGLDGSLFKKLRAIVNGDIKVDETEADELFDLYIEELDKLSNTIDKMSVSGK